MVAPSLMFSSTLPQLSLKLTRTTMDSSVHKFFQLFKLLIFKDICLEQQCVSFVSFQMEMTILQ